MLKKTFPNIQFIITTHSPQILGEVDHDFNVYALSRNGSDIQVVQTTGMFGMDSTLFWKTNGNRFGKCDH